MPHQLDPDLDHDDNKQYNGEPTDDLDNIELPAVPHHDIAAKMGRIIDYMAGEEMDLPNFLYYLSWNLQLNTDDAKIRYARTLLMHTDMLASILEKWYWPPRKHGEAIRTKAARMTMERWADENVRMRMNREMRLLKPLVLSPPEELSEESLLNVKLSRLTANYQRVAPLTWSLLHAALSTPLQLQRNTYKNHAPSIVAIISMLSFGRSHHRCKFQKFMSIYFTSCGLSAKANNTTHMLGVTMSQKWKYIGLEKLAQAKRNTMQRDLHEHVKEFTTSYDNLNVRFNKIEQHVDNQSVFESGCAATVYVLECQDIPLPDAQSYQEQWRRECNHPITAFEILELDSKASERLFAFNKWRVLNILLNSPQFDRTKYSHEDDTCFSRPLPIRQLPTGKAHVRMQYLLDTAHIEEVSLEGNDRCVAEWERQLGLGTDTAKKRMSHKKLFFWLGDQLTVSHLRSLQNIRAQDLNWWHRMEHIVALFGWLHAQIAQEDSIHKQHLTTGIGGLKHAFDLLKCKGLHFMSVQGNFHQKVCNAYHHILEAHILDVWEVVGGVDHLAKLREKSPEVLVSLAEGIVENYASTFAYQKEKQRNTAQQDHVFMNQILLNRDLLDYVNLDNAMHTGDVGRMIDLLPRLLFRYHGGSNWKYVIEMLELFQGLLREWPEDLREFILRYCWLANTNNGKAFLAFDMLQEHNIRDIKSIFMVYGPYATWEYIQKISAAIPTLRKVKDHVEADFNHFSRGKSHSSPDKEKDITQLQAAYKLSQVHIYTPKQQLDSSRRAKDFVALGSNIVKLQATIGRWSEKRLVSRAATEIWEDPEVVEGGDQRASETNSSMTIL
ncbi:hypothetical protein BC835DRAFT_1414500 [Cytidiella melzeri]|nr:hypothetical protein BC835DRAFT_1414500 [Cytidiella melzeri]